MASESGQTPDPLNDVDAGLADDVQQIVPVIAESSFDLEASDPAADVAPDTQSQAVSEVQSSYPEPLLQRAASPGDAERATPTENLFARVTEEPYSFDFFQLVRRMECLHRELPPVGHSLHPNHDALRFCQEPSLKFHPATVQQFRPATEIAPARLFVNFLGLLGPHGPLPLHLTEYARDRERNHSDPGMARFMDLFNHRMIALFYRAWASSSLVVNYERGIRADSTKYRAGNDRFAFYVGTLFGIGSESLRGRDAVPDVARLHYSGRLVCQTRNAEGLCAIIGDFFKIETDIEQFVGEWVDVPEQYHCRLGDSLQTCALGSTAIVGRRIWDCQHKFRLRLGPMSFDDYQRMLPGGASLRRLVDWVRTYVGDEFAWDVQLLLKAREIPLAQLGRQGRLGWTTWVRCGAAATRDAGDLILNPAATAA